MQRFQIDYTIGKELEDEPLHVPVIRTTLTRNLGQIFPELADEMRLAVDSAFTGNEGMAMF